MAHRSFAQILNRKLTTTGFALIAASFAVIAVVFAPQQSTPAPTAAAPVCVAEASNNYCAPQLDTAGRALVAKAKADGYTCTGSPALTDVIIFTFRDGDTNVVTLAEALKYGEAGKGWVQSYCKVAPK